MVIVFPSGSSMIIFGENCSPRRKASSRWYGLQWLLDDELLPHEGGVKSLHLKVTIVWDMCMQYVDDWLKHLRTELHIKSTGFDVQLPGGILFAIAIKFQGRCDPWSSRRRAEGLSS